MAKLTWGSLAENRGVASRGAADVAQHESSYRRVTSDERRRSSMPNGRGSTRGWEVRLGAPQVVIWLGLAVGAMVGAYFVGFFSGQAVGFESARSASGVEVAKLAIEDELPERSNQNVSAIYDKLNAPALMDEAPQVVVQPKSKKGAEQELPAVRVAKEIRSGEVTRSKGSTPSILGNGGIPGDGAMLGEGASNAEVDLFEYDAAAGAATNEVTTEESTVRFLGAKSDGASDIPEKTLGAILEERLAKARMESARINRREEEFADSKPAPKAQLPAESVKQGEPVKQVELAKQQAVAQPDPQAKVVAPSNESNFVKRIVPPGYFAQVAAPKNRSDAESVARKLKRSGFPVVVEVASVRGEEYFRVLVGPEQSRVHADRLVDQLQSERYISGAPFVRQVK